MSGVNFNIKPNNIMPPELIREFRAFVIEGNREHARIAAVNPYDPSLKAYVANNFKKVEWYLAKEKDIEAALKSFSPDEVENLSQETKNEDENNDLVEAANRILKHALKRKASDIHIEPDRRGTSVRFRMDGILHEVARLPRKMHQPLIARFKIMANLKFDEYRRPQDGRIEPEDIPETSFRVSTMPTLFGEKIALRVLNDSNKAVELEKLGLNPKERNILMENLQKPHGLIVTSGPTGSGKTTTLYSILQAIDKDGLNISTLEDPIEYTLEGVNQIQINPRVDLTFASGLRSLLRQDPDIMMVGEIRDTETAMMAADAAMTGHLVLATLHTNDAPSAYSRFLEMKVEDFVVASTINLVIAQRLVRKVCSFCKKEKRLDPPILNKLKERTDVLSALKKATRSDFKDIQMKKFTAGTGCSDCLGSGYNGRIGIFELLVPTKRIKDMVLAHASAEDIKATAETSGFRSITENGIDKVLSGATTIEEIMRTTK